jgi:hypothetical protein
MTATSQETSILRLGDVSNQFNDILMRCSDPLQRLGSASCDEDPCPLGGERQRCRASDT